MARKAKSKGIVKVNVIPILDAVFIFIFFLLMSAQFVEIYQLETDAPQISEVKEKSKKIPLNLTLKIKRNEIVITSGVSGKVEGKIKAVGKEYDFEGLKRKIASIKDNHKDEKSVILMPAKSVKYKNVVKIIDTVKGDQDRTLFDQIIFETIN